jgi:peptidyl-prolyl cis-trans isomerase C
MPRALQRRLAALVLTCAAAIAAPAMAQTVARVDGAEITEQDVKIAMEDIGGTLPQQMTPDQRRAYVVNYLIDMKLVSRKAEAAKLAEGEAFQRKVAYFRQKALMQGQLDVLRDAAATEAALKAVYAEAAKKQGDLEEVKASHILVGTEDEAKAALKRVRGGEEFAKVAKDVSKDPGSPGGALGWFSRERMVPSFADMAFKTPKGTISEPVQSQFGWHIILVEDRRVTPFPPFEAVREQIVRHVSRQAHQKEIEALRQGAKIERIEPVPGPAQLLPLPRP